jgi:Fe-S-cluster containining protein
MAKKLPLHSDIDETATWAKYSAKLCQSCHATCCTLPVEVHLSDLVRIGVVSEFETNDPIKKIAKRLKKDGIIEHLNYKNELFTLTRMANDDCVYLDTRSRRCTIYELRPNTCRNHPQVGPLPGFCPYQPK